MAVADPSALPGGGCELAVSDLVVRYRSTAKRRGWRFGGAPDRTVVPASPSKSALDGVTLRVGRGESVGIVGESGSGKSTLAKAIFGLVPIVGGDVTIDGRPVGRRPIWTDAEMVGKAQYVFQDPFSSLNPAKRIIFSVSEPVRGMAEAVGLAEKALRAVGLDPGTDGRRFPSQLSGGQCQRACLARALITRPRLLVCDEIVSALDVSVQAQVLNLLSTLQSELGMSMLFISHDLAVASIVCDRLVVMKGGKVVEQGPTSDVLGSPNEPYTRALIEAIPGTGLREGGRSL